MNQTFPSKKLNKGVSGMEEVWRDIPGYVGIYEVSTLGRVRKKEGGRILKARKSRGYMRLWLYKDKLKKDWYVHRLVALAFLCRPPGKELINHLMATRRTIILKI
nr:hypothetical protein 36.1 - phage SPP1 [Bacillus phage SPP1]